MHSHWSSVSLSVILHKSTEPALIEPQTCYREVTVRLWGKGVVKRRNVFGSGILTGPRFLVRQGQFILSRIDARSGALGLVPPELDGAIVTNDFPVFNIDTSLVFPPFLEWVSRTAAFLNICRLASEGTTNRVRLKEERFLSTSIQVPSLEEQVRLVNRMNRIFSRIEEARTLKKEVLTAYDNLMRSLILGDSNTSFPLKPLSELLRIREPDIKVDSAKTYQFAGVYSFGRGIFRGPRKRGADFAYSRLTRLKTGNFVYPKLMAWEGALGAVPADYDGLVVSPEFPVFEVDQSLILPETLDVYFRTPHVWPLLHNLSTGTNVRRRRLHPSNFLTMEIPVPPMATQLQLRALKAQMSTILPLHQSIAAELDVLGPSILDRLFTTVSTN